MDFLVPLQLMQLVTTYLKVLGLRLEFKRQPFMVLMMMSIIKIVDLKKLIALVAIKGAQISIQATLWLHVNLVVLHMMQQPHLLQSTTTLNIHYISAFTMGFIS